jgi:hypothetical protein
LAGGLCTRPLLKPSSVNFYQIFKNLSLETVHLTSGIKKHCAFSVKGHFPVGNPHIQDQFLSRKVAFCNRYQAQNQRFGFSRGLLQGIKIKQPTKHFVLFIFNNRAAKILENY